MNHVARGSNWAEQMVRSMCVNVLWVEKWVGLLLFSIERFECSMKSSTTVPLWLAVGEPHSGLQLLKSPQRITGVLTLDKS